MLTYRLPSFLEYLSANYSALYQSYLGRLTELFPSSEKSDDNLVIADEEEEEHSGDSENIRRLWRIFDI